jgi:hypothetical protein
MQREGSFEKKLPAAEPNRRIFMNEEFEDKLLGIA